MPQCFIIQPFDKNKFDKRYKDAFSPAIENAGFKPYRVDQDNSVKVVIQKIETEIKKSEICFADITTNNPNVWYELGFAFACNKEVLMVCSEERVGDFPFDIRHRFILKYKNDSSSDFEELKKNITERLKELSIQSKTVEKLNNSTIRPQEGLESHEITALVIIGQNQISPTDYIYIDDYKKEMERSGYTSIASSLSSKSLINKGLVLIDTIQERERNWDMPYNIDVLKLTEKGEKWLFENSSKLIFRKKVEDSKKNNDSIIDDDLPF